MSKFSINRINDVEVKEVPLLHEKDTRPVRGEKLFPEIYSNIFLCSKKKSGKTSTIYKILNSCSSRDTKVVAFCSTLYKDPSWETITAWCESNGLDFTGHTSLKDDDGTDLLDQLIHELETGDTEPVVKEPEQKNDWVDEPFDSSLKKKKKKSKYRAPEYIIILDDLSNELKSTSVTALLKKNRHFKSKIILSSQYLNDLLPAARKQLDYLILFRGHPDKKLVEVHRDADVSIPISQFQELYKFATKEAFSFLYIDTTTGKFRRNFNSVIKIS